MFSAFVWLDWEQAAAAKQFVNFNFSLSIGFFHMAVSLCLSLSLFWVKLFRMIFECSTLERSVGEFIYGISNCVFMLAYGAVSVCVTLSVRRVWFTLCERMLFILSFRWMFSFFGSHTHPRTHSMLRNLEFSFWTIDNDINGNKNYA